MEGRGLKGKYIVIFIVEGKALYLLRVLNLWRAIRFPNYLAFSDLKIAATLTDLMEE